MKKVFKIIDSCTGNYEYIKIMNSIEKLQSLYSSSTLLVDSHLWQWLNNQPIELVSRWIDARAAYLKGFDLEVDCLPILNQDDTLCTMKHIFDHWHWSKHKALTSHIEKERSRDTNSWFTRYTEISPKHNKQVK